MMPLSPAVRLKMAMEQRARRCEMEALLYSDDPVLPEFRSPSGKNNKKKNAAATNTSANANNNKTTPPTTAPTLPTSAAAAPPQSPPHRSTTTHSNVLNYIVDSVDAAIGAYNDDPDNFFSYTLVLAPAADHTALDDDANNEQEEDGGDDRQRKAAVVASSDNNDGDAAASPRQEKKGKTTNALHLHQQHDGGNRNDDDKSEGKFPGNNAEEEIAQKSTTTTTTTTSKTQEHMCGDQKEATPTPAVAARKRSGYRMIQNADAITRELLPVVCEYVNSRLARYGLQSVSLPTLTFSSQVSGIVIETLINNWISTAGTGGGAIRLKNLFFSDAASATFLSRDYARLVHALNANRLSAIALDRRQLNQNLRVQRAATQMEWCDNSVAVTATTMASSSSHASSINNYERRNSSQSQRHHAQPKGSSISSFYHALKMRDEQDLNCLKREKKQRPVFATSTQIAVTKRKTPSASPSASASASTPHLHTAATIGSGGRRNTASASSQRSFLSTTSSSYSPPSMSKPRTYTRESNNDNSASSSLRDDNTTSTAEKNPISSPLLSAKPSSSSPASLPSPLFPKDSSRCTVDSSSISNGNTNSNHNNSDTTRSHRTHHHHEHHGHHRHHKRTRERREAGEQRTGAEISEVELQGNFARVIASESKRRYRLMQIELDELVPILVGLSLAKTETVQV